MTPPSTGRVDDRPTIALIDRRPHRVLRRKKHRAQTDPEGPIPLLFGAVDHVVERGDPDVVDEHVEPTEGGHRSVDGLAVCGPPHTGPHTFAVPPADATIFSVSPARSQWMSTRTTFKQAG